MRVQADLSALTDRQFERVVDALLDARGYPPLFAAGDDEALKAAGDGHRGDRWRTRYLEELWLTLETIFSGFVDGVLSDLSTALEAGDIRLPLDRERGDHATVAERLGRRAAALLYSVGVQPPPAEAAAIAAFIRAEKPWMIDFVEAAYRVGLAHRDIQVSATWPEAWQTAASRPLTRVDRAAIAYLRSKGAAYLQPIFDRSVHQVTQRLTWHQSITRARTLGAAHLDVREMQGRRIHPERLAGFMADLTGRRVDRGDGKLIWAGGQWDRDWRRVARTEMAFSNNYGHLVDMLARHPINAERGLGPQTGADPAPASAPPSPTRPGDVTGAEPSLPAGPPPGPRPAPADRPVAPGAPAVVDAESPPLPLPRGVRRFTVGDVELGVPPLLVYKVTQRVERDGRGRLMAPCTHCYRIWHYDEETPRLYPLDAVLDNGENVGRKGPDWVATVGPTHPNDVCGPLQQYVPLANSLFPGFARQIEAYRGQGFEGVD